MREEDDWVDRAKSIEITESPPSSIDRDGCVIVAATESALAADISLQLGMDRASNPTCIVSTQVPPKKLYPYLTDRAPTRPAVGFVDATTNRLNPSIPPDVLVIKNIPSAHDLLQLTTAISDVVEAIAPPDQPTNIVVPVFDSFLDAAPTDRVIRVLSHVAESTEADGRVVIGLNYTRGSTETLQSLKRLSNAILWVERDSRDEVTLNLDSL